MPNQARMNIFGKTFSKARLELQPEPVLKPTTVVKLHRFLQGEWVKMLLRGS